MKYLLITINLLLMLFLSIVSAEVQSLPTQKQNSIMSIEQTCSSCTYVNIDSIKFPNSTRTYYNAVMTKNGYSYSYSFDDTSQLGEYIVTTCGDVDSVVTCVDYNFNVTPSGFENILGFYVIIILLIYGIGFFGFFGRNQWVAVLGGLAMISLGLFTILNGIDVYRNNITDVFSWVTIGLGAIFALTAAVSIIEDNL